MRKNKSHISFLQDFLNNREMNTSDMKLLFRMYNSPEGQAEIKDFLDENWTTDVEDGPIEIDSHKILREIQSAIQSEQYRTINKSKTLFQWTTVAAAVILFTLLISVSLFFNVSPKSKEKIAVLNEVVASAGYMKNLQLPDGTNVWLNPGSSLLYSVNMTNEKIRDVRLWGQAYFEIAKNPEKPFVLQLGDVGLKVTGTSFNASNYQDDPNIEVVLKTGEVKLFEGAYSDAEKFITLSAGEIARYKKGDTGFKIEKTDTEKYTAWTHGVLIFRDELMADVFRRMERWYNVKIVVEDPGINNYRYTATIKNESLEQILQLLEYTSHLECDLVKNNHSENSKSIIRIKTKNNMPMK